MFIPDQTIQTSRRGNDDMGTGIRVLDQFDILLDRRAAVKHGSPHFRQVLAESRVLVSDLEGQFTGVAENEDSDFPIHGLDLLEGREDKDGRLTET